ncbi:MAG: T9SS C-terminal target domain-containing protein, partial [Bacteroidetes bacterium]
SQPNFPNYRLGTGYPVCDSNIVLTATPQIFRSSEVVRLYPNPVADILNVELFEPFRNPGQLILYNQAGQAVRRLDMESGVLFFQFSVSDLTGGLYFYQMLEGGMVRKTGKVMVLK